MKLQHMDLKTFSENDFDPKKWINRAWSTSGNQEKEVFVANAVSRLQLYMKQLTNSLDETTTQIVTSLPRLLQDAAQLEQEGLLLQKKLLSLEDKVQSVEERTGHSIESLQRIDKLKSRLESAASTLQEADKWTALTASLESLLESGVPTSGDKLKELSKQVAAMTQSLEVPTSIATLYILSMIRLLVLSYESILLVDVLHDAPDYESKRLQLETLYNRLEAAISPPLIEALTHMNSDRTSIYVGLFEGMNRMVSVCRCWRRAAAARLATTWNRLDAHSLPALTRILNEDAGKQIEWLINVLKSPTPIAELVRLYTDLLLSLEPTPTKIITANLKMYTAPNDGINFLVDLKKDIFQLVNCIKTVIDTPRPNQETLPKATATEFGRAAYAPLREVLPKYTDMQTQILLELLNDKNFTQEDVLEQSRAVLILAERVDSILESSYEKAKKIAGVAVYPFYVPALEEFVNAVSSLISSHSRKIENEFLTSITAGQVAGVLSNTFPASITLESATAVLLDTLAERHKAEAADEVPKYQHPFEDLPLLMLDNEGRQKLIALKKEGPSAANLRKAKEQLRSLARAILRQPVDMQLEKIPQLPVWSNNDAFTTDLPDFALSPQEYITEIGQYLMTLPQHLEMHLPEKHAPWQFLTEVCMHTCDVYSEKILSIRNMDELGTKRCITDIVYLSSVVEDLLGTSITPSLKNLEKSLRAATPNQTTAE